MHAAIDSTVEFSKVLFNLNTIVNLKKSLRLAMIRPVGMEIRNSSVININCSKCEVKIVLQTSGSKSQEWKP